MYLATANPHLALASAHAHTEELIRDAEHARLARQLRPARRPRPALRLRSPRRPAFTAAACC